MTSGPAAPCRWVVDQGSISLPLGPLGPMDAQVGRWRSKGGEGCRGRDGLPASLSGTLKAPRGFVGAAANSEPDRCGACGQCPGGPSELYRAILKRTPEPNLTDRTTGPPPVLGRLDFGPAWTKGGRLVWFAERRFQQACGVTLTKSCRCNNSSGNHFTRHFELIDVT